MLICGYTENDTTRNKHSINFLTNSPHTNNLHKTRMDLKKKHENNTYKKKHIPHHNNLNNHSQHNILNFC